MQSSVKTLMPPIVRAYVFIFFLLVFHTALAKNDEQQLESIPDVPTKTIYDLFLDRQNFLWLATEVGVYRFDGLNFTLFSTDDQSSLETSGLSQDNFGRIWFYNFTGQIFYIENEQVHHLRAYDDRTESRFARILIHNDFLYATSDKGLFVCDTRTLQSSYIGIKNATSGGITSLAVIGSKIVAYGKAGWYAYEPGSPGKLLRLHTRMHPLSQQESTLFPFAFQDKLLLFSNPSGTLTKLDLKKDSLIASGHHAHRQFINTISLLNGRLWINSPHKSMEIDGALTVTDRNISDIAADKEGNIWFSSLTNGLLVKRNHVERQKISLPAGAGNDIVRSLVRHKDLILMGTDKGKIYTYDHRTGHFNGQIRLPHNAHSVRKLAMIDEHRLIVGTSIHTYVLDFRTDNIEVVPSLHILKQIDKAGATVFATTANGLVALPGDGSAQDRQEFKRQFRGISEYNVQSNSFSYGKRSDAVAYYPEEKTLFVGFKNTLHKINEKGISPVIFQGKPIYCAALLYQNNKVYIGTINNGLLIYDRGRYTKFTVRNGAMSNSILKLRKSKNTVWLLSAGAVQAFDIRRNKFGNYQNLSVSDNVLTTDLMVLDHYMYLATVDGLYKLPLNPSISNEKITNHLFGVRVNDEMTEKRGLFEPDQNSIQFTISVPLYNKSKQTFIKYSLKSEKDSIWNVTSPGERSITFASLAPGKYTFQALAVNPELGSARNPVIYQFEIRHSWWQVKTFQYFVMAMFVCFLIYILIRVILDRQAYKRTIYQQQQLIIEERQRISSEIHDDIGAGIFAIKLLADVASNTKDSGEDIRNISFMVNDIAKKIREIIWSTNADNDNLPDLITYLKQQTLSLLEHAHVAAKVTIPETIPALAIVGRKRKEIVLLVKEFIYNALRHAKASVIILEIQVSDNTLEIRIADNGTGFDAQSVNPNSMGLKNAQKRAARLGGTIVIASKAGTNVCLKIPLDGLES